MKVDLSIIIVSFNTKQLLEKCLNSVFSGMRSAKFSWEVIVVDNASTDGSWQMIKEKFIQVELIKNKENIGFGRANNQAAKMAKGEYLLFLNSDTEVLGNAIEKLYRFAEDQEKSGIYGGKLFNLDKTPQPSCGHFYSLPIIFLSLFLKGDQLHVTRFSPNKVKETDWVSGACLLMHRDVFQELGGFDEKIFMYMDEIDFCFRAKKKGYRIIFYPKAHFIHVGSASSKDRREPYSNLFQGLIYFYQKHRPEKLWMLKIMLKLKILIAVTTGKVLRNKSLVENYGKAMKKLEVGSKK